MSADCPHCGELEAIKENYRLAEAVARGEESRAKRLESDLHTAAIEVRLCHQRLQQLEAALKTYGQHRWECQSVAGGIRCSCGFDPAALRGTPNA